MKHKLNLIGGGFQHHSHCSSAFNKNKIVEWILDYSADQSIYVDHAILNGEIKENKENYGWLAESSAIIPSVIEEVKSNLNSYFDKFKYIFTHDVRLLTLHPNFKFTIANALPWIQDKKIYPKTKKISMIASNKTMSNGHKYRQEVIEKYKGLVDHFGTGYNELPWATKAGTESGKIYGLKDYMFSIAMENDNYDTIFCEKLTDCFVTGTIPIYWGPRSIDNFFNIDGVIFLEDLKSIDDLTEDLYKSKMQAIVDNFNRTMNLDSAEDYFTKLYLWNH